MPHNPDYLSAEPDNLAWVATLQGLEDARVHIGELIEQMQAEKRICAIDFGIQIGHIYGHLNRVWNGRHLPGDNVEIWCSDDNSQFPTDVTIV